MTDLLLESRLLLQAGLKNGHKVYFPWLNTYSLMTIMNFTRLYKANLVYDIPPDIDRLVNILNNIVRVYNQTLDYDTILCNKDYHQMDRNAVLNKTKLDISHLFETIKDIRNEMKLIAPIKSIPSRPISLAQPLISGQ